MNNGTPSVRSAMVDNLVGQRLAAGDLRYESGPVAPIQAIERQHRHLRLAGPVRLELGAECDEQ
jgi:hypothetical protein